MTTPQSLYYIRSKLNLTDWIPLESVAAMPIRKTYDYKMMILHLLVSSYCVQCIRNLQHTYADEFVETLYEYLETDRYRKALNKYIKKYKTNIAYRAIVQWAIRDTSWKLRQERIPLTFTDVLPSDVEEPEESLLSISRTVQYDNTSCITDVERSAIKGLFRMLNIPNDRPLNRTDIAELMKHKRITTYVKRHLLIS